MKIEIKHRYTGGVIYSHDCEKNSIKITLMAAIAYRVNLSLANLRGANLRGANLRGADLSEANLRLANLRLANLRGANLSGVDFSVADLSEANLSGADLSWANLRGANLSGVDFSVANLSGADLSEANLRGANLRGALGNNNRMSCLQLGRYRIVVLDCEICWGGCTKKTVTEWLKYKGGELSDSDGHYLKTVTKPFLRMCLKMRDNA